MKSKNENEWKKIQLKIRDELFKLYKNQAENNLKTKEIMV